MEVLEGNGTSRLQLRTFSADSAVVRNAAVQAASFALARHTWSRLMCAQGLVARSLIADTACAPHEVLERSTRDRLRRYIQHPRSAALKSCMRVNSRGKDMHCGDDMRKAHMGSNPVDRHQDDLTLDLKYAGTVVELKYDAYAMVVAYGPAKRRSPMH
jgi:hypothetical protein